MKKVLIQIKFAMCIRQQKRNVKEVIEYKVELRGEVCSGRKDLDIITMEMIYLRLWDQKRLCRLRVTVDRKENTQN